MLGSNPRSLRLQSQAQVGSPEPPGPIPASPPLSGGRRRSLPAAEAAFEAGPEEVRSWPHLQGAGCCCAWGMLFWSGDDAFLVGGGCSFGPGMMLFWSGEDAL